MQKRKKGLGRWRLWRRQLWSQEFWAVFTLLGAALLALTSLAQGAESFPQVEMIRYLERGGTETLSLRCCADATGDAHYRCELSAFHNDGRWGRKWISARVVGPWLMRAMHDLTDPSHRALASTFGEKGNPEDRLLHWKIQYQGKISQGGLRQSLVGQSADTLAAVLKLEGKMMACLID